MNNLFLPFGALSADAAAWVQAGTGIIAAILSGITIWQSRKIQELVDLNASLIAQTSELAKQTTELTEIAKTNRNRFELELAHKQNDIEPNLRYIEHSIQSDWNAVDITLQNFGATALQLRLREWDFGQFFVERTHFKRLCEKGMKMTIRLEFRDSVIIPLPDFELSLMFETTLSRSYVQTISCSAGIITARTPIDVTHTGKK